MSNNHREIVRRELLAVAGAFGINGLMSACSEPMQAVHSDVGMKIIAEPNAVLITRWRSDPFARGSYSYLAKGSTPGDRDILAKPHAGRLFFAGEAVSRKYPATVHGALLSGQHAADKIIQEKHKSVIIVGAGAAGLAAANRIAAAGISVQVIEARDRIGGRVWTDERWGLPLDLGASWIHGVEKNPLIDLANKIDLLPQKTDYDNYRARTAGGQIVDQARLPEDFKMITEVEHEYAADIENLSKQACTEGLELDGGDAWLPGGYIKILESLVIGFEVKLRTMVQRVAIADQMASVETHDGVYRADAVVVTVPLGVLKAGDIAFEPPLYPERKAAIDRLGMGLLDKIYLRFDEIFWDVDVDVIGYLGPKRDQFAEWFNLAKYIGEPILVGFNAASAAEELQHLSDDQIVKKAMHALRNMYQT